MMNILALVGKGSNLSGTFMYFSGAMEPVFRCLSTGQPLLKETAAAKSYTRPGGRAVSGEEVEKKAKATLKRDKQDTSKRSNVLGRYELQFGKYQGCTFKWVLENALGWAGFIGASTKKEKPSTSNISVNKFAFLVSVTFTSLFASVFASNSNYT